MDESLRIRRATRADADRVREVYERAMRDADAFLPVADHSDLDAPTEAYAGGAFLVGEGEDSVVATGGVRPVTGRDAGKKGDTDGNAGDAPAFEMKRLAVVPGRQGTGYGRRLVRALEDRARDLGAARLVLETSETQTAARGLYESQGYERVDRVAYAGGEIVGIRYERRL